MTQTTHHGSLLDRALEMLTPLGRMAKIEYRRKLLAFCETKEQASNLHAELVKRGFLSHSLELSPAAFERVRKHTRRSSP